MTSTASAVYVIARCPSSYSLLEVRVRVRARARIKVRVRVRVSG